MRLGSRLETSYQNIGLSRISTGDRDGGIKIYSISPDKDLSSFKLI